jgi:hypothetical protein
MSIEDEMAAEVAALSTRLAAPSGDRIKITKKGTFKLPNGEENDHLSVIVVEFVNTNSYYDKPFVDGEGAVPACYAVGELGNDKLVPSPNSPVPQADSCAECWANEFKSAPNGKGKACANNRLLAVTAPGEEDEPLLLLKVPTTSMKSFDAFADGVARAFKRPLRGVIAEVISNGDLDWQNCQFGNPEPVDRDQLMRVHARKGEAQQRLMVEPDFSQYQAPVEKKSAVKGRAPVSKRG